MSGVERVLTEVAEKVRRRALIDSYVDGMGACHFAAIVKNQEGRMPQHDYWVYLAALCVEQASVDYVFADQFDAARGEAGKDKGE